MWVELDELFWAVMCSLVALCTSETPFPKILSQLTHHRMNHAWFITHRSRLVWWVSWPFFICLFVCFSAFTLSNQFFGFDICLSLLVCEKKKVSIRDHPENLIPPKPEFIQDHKLRRDDPHFAVRSLRRRWLVFLLQTDRSQTNKPKRFWPGQVLAHPLDI